MLFKSAKAIQPGDRLLLADCFHGGSFSVVVVREVNQLSEESPLLQITTEKGLFIHLAKENVVLVAG